MRDTAARLRGLYAITDPALQPAAELSVRVDAALAGGACVLQYRDKGRDMPRRRHEAAMLRKLCRRHGAVFIVNDDVELAAEVAADGVHVGEADAAVAAARERLGPEMLIGASCYARPDLADAAVAAGADYVAFGSVFASSMKPHAPRVSLDMLAQECRRLPVPVVAIGGIDAASVPQLVRCGVAAVAVIHGVFGGTDVTARARAIATCFPVQPLPG